MNIVQSAVPPLLSPELLAKLPRHRRREICGDRRRRHQAPYVTEERDLFQGRSPLVLRPGSTTEVAAICKLASEHKIALVPQGGNTGLVGGQTPHNGEVVVSLRRLDKIRDIDVAIQHHDLSRPASSCRSRSRRRPRPTGCSRCRSARKVQLHHRRQSLDQCRRHRGTRLWRSPRDGARARGRARRWPRLERLRQAEEGQHRLRPAQPLHRRGRHARHHHRGDAEAVSAAARGRATALSRLPRRKPRSSCCRSRATRPPVR
jgi:hypothetical protein